MSNDSKGTFTFEVATRQLHWGKSKAAHRAFNALKGTSPQLLKSNLRTELGEVKGLALAFDVDKGGMSHNSWLKSTHLTCLRVGRQGDTGSNSLRM